MPDDTLLVPLVACVPLQLPEAVQDVALAADHVRVEAVLTPTLALLKPIVIAGATETPVMVTTAVLVCIVPGSALLSMTLKLVLPLKDVAALTGTVNVLLELSCAAHVRIPLVAV